MQLNCKYICKCIYRVDGGLLLDAGNSGAGL